SRVGKILRYEPHRAIVNRIDGHAGVVAPTITATASRGEQLRSLSSEDFSFTFHLIQWIECSRVGCITNTRKQCRTRRAISEQYVSKLVLSNAAHPPPGCRIR